VESPKADHRGRDHCGKEALTARLTNKSKVGGVPGHRLLPAEDSPWRRVVPVAAVVLLVLHLAIAGRFWVRNVKQVWFSGRSRPAASELASFAVAHIGSRADVLYVSPTARSEQLWSYFLLSYSLYPSRVWWVSPACVSTWPFWCIYSPVTSERLTSLANVRGANYLILDGLKLPDLQASSVESASDTHRTIVQLHSRSN